MKFVEGLNLHSARLLDFSSKDGEVNQLFDL